MARVVSLLVAVVTALAGHGMLFFAAFYLQRSLGGFASFALPGFVVPLALLGIVLIGVTALTAAWSSLGVLVVGIVETVVGLFGALVPPIIPTDGFRSPRVLLSQGLVALGPLGSTADYWLAVGLSIIEGALLLGLAWAAARRRRALVARPAVARLVSMLVTFVALGPATVLALVGGVRNERRMFAAFAGLDPAGVILLALGVLLLTGLIICVRWSGLGAIVWGAALMSASASAAFVPLLLPRTQMLGYRNPVGLATRGLPPEVASSVLSSLTVGAIAVIGAIFLFGGIAGARAGRVGLRRQTFVAAPTGEVAEVVPGPPA